MHVNQVVLLKDRHISIALPDDDLFNGRWGGGGGGGEVVEKRGNRRMVTARSAVKP